MNKVLSRLSLIKPFINRFTKTALFILITSLAISASASEDKNSAASKLLKEKRYKQAEVEISKDLPSVKTAFMKGYALFKQDKFLQSFQNFVKAENELPQLADYSLYFQIVSQKELNQKLSLDLCDKFLAKHPQSILLLKVRKTRAELLFQLAEYRNAISEGRAIIASSKSVKDAVFAKLIIAKSEEMLGEYENSAKDYKEIWIEHPELAEAESAEKRLLTIAKTGVNQLLFSDVEKMRRADNLFKKSRYSAAIKGYSALNKDKLSKDEAVDIITNCAISSIKLKKYREAESFLKQAESIAAKTSQKNKIFYWYGKLFERQNLDNEALSKYQIVGEDITKPFAEDALAATAGIKKSQKKYAEAASIYEKLSKKRSPSNLIYLWNCGWSLYLNRDFLKAAERFKTLSSYPEYTEKSLYWLAKGYELSGRDKEAQTVFKRLANEYPTGFYVIWHRDITGIKDNKDIPAQPEKSLKLQSLAGSERAYLLASMGLFDEAKGELAFLRQKSRDNDKQTILAHINSATDIEDYSSAIYLFNKIKPAKFDSNTFALWRLAFPAPYNDIVKSNSEKNGVPESLIYALTRSESAFIPTIKSSAGAIGLMQLMPATAKMTAKEKNFSSSKLIEPQYNIKLGTKHFRELVNLYKGDIIYSIAAYNAGANAVKRWRTSFDNLEKDEFIENIPFQETKDYVKKVYTSAAIYKELYKFR